MKTLNILFFAAILLTLTACGSDDTVETNRDFVGAWQTESQSANFKASASGNPCALFNVNATGTDPVVYSIDLDVQKIDLQGNILELSTITAKNNGNVYKLSGHVDFSGNITIFPNSLMASSNSKNALQGLAVTTGKDMMQIQSAGVQIPGSLGANTDTLNLARISDRDYKELIQTAVICLKCTADSTAKGCPNAPTLPSWFDDLKEELKK